MKKLKLIVGGGLEDDAGAFLDAWHRAKRGQKVRERAIAFEMDHERLRENIVSSYSGASWGCRERMKSAQIGGKRGTTAGSPGA